jgi:hypothetical protein
MGTMKENARKDLEVADAELNTVYKKILATRSEKGIAALREAQRAWIIYRDATAEAYGTGEEGGSLEALMVLRCSEALTKSRPEAKGSELSIDTAFNVSRDTIDLRHASTFPCAISSQSISN